MNRTAKKRDVPHLDPVIKVELKDDKYNKFRLAAAILMLAVGAGLLTYAVVSLLNTSKGWSEIEANSASELNCSGDFVFLYNLGAGDVSATAENKAIRLLYTDAVVKAYQLFNNDMEFENVHNLYYINHHPNEVIEVDPLLYEAFSLLESCQERSVYMAPVYEVYDNLFYCTQDELTSSFDPWQNEELAEFFGQIAQYAASGDNIRIELLGDNQICLFLAPEYQDYLDSEQAESYVDFYWMKNAFIVDYLAEVMIENGYTSGTISSHDGFTRTLDGSGESYSLNLFDRAGDTVYQAGVLQYTEAVSAVSLHNYPIHHIDSKYYYEFQNGEIRTAYLSLADGLCKSSKNDLVMYSRELGCAQILMRMIPVYIADVWDVSAVAGLKQEGICSVYCEDSVIYSNDTAVTVTDLFANDSISYQVRKF